MMIYDNTIATNLSDGHSQVAVASKLIAVRSERRRGGRIIAIVNGRYLASRLAARGRSESFQAAR
jgi:hypothetical protein